MAGIQAPLEENKEKDNRVTYLQNIENFCKLLKIKYKIIGNISIDDLKIASTAKSLTKLDVVLTADKKTFTPICAQLDIPFVETSNLPKDLFDDINTTIFQ